MTFDVIESDVIIALPRSLLMEFVQCLWHTRDTARVFPFVYVRAFACVYLRACACVCTEGARKDYSKT